MTVLLKTENLKKYYRAKNHKAAGKKNGLLRAVDGVSFEIEKGTVFGVVGESGSGKSTIGRCILNLTRPTAGNTFYEGVNLGACGKKEWAALQRKMQVIFQNPYSSFNPLMTIGQSLQEVGRVHRMEKREIGERIAWLLEGIELPLDSLSRKPQELSGGQLQRFAIARSLVLKPDFILADEPVSALDVSVQAHVLNLLLSFKEKLGLTILFISHELAVVEHVCDTVAVVYLGKIMEIAPVDDLFGRMKHPYSRALISAKPKEHPLQNKERILLKGSPQDALDPPSGCRFAPRCPSRFGELCEKEVPVLKQVGNAHYAACHLYS
ncbi:MAG: ABC transporter ATP-binding protein [Synergistaceae bacterium]|jgi:peptide/nickel transport system ATP-binding protein/oligopeptide transport system ATP-binding protein|nr:ABC transporter ATP-binding protein [Synergistaceae bacterium]